MGQGPLAHLLGLAPASVGGVGGIIGAAFGGFRAAGGPVSPGKAYVVGEGGPEVFVPRSRGSVVPNHAIDHGRSVTVNAPVTVNVEGGSRGAIADHELAQRIGAEVKDAIRGVVIEELIGQRRQGGLMAP